MAASVEKHSQAGSTGSRNTDTCHISPTWRHCSTISSPTMPCRRWTQHAERRTLPDRAQFPWEAGSIMAATNGSSKTSYMEADYTDFAHTGPGTLAGRYLRRFWQPVYLGRELQIGHARPIRIMSEDFTLYRGESGQVHLLAYRCAHRGTQLSTGWVEGDCIRCFYHGWKYDHTGQCVDMPAENAAFPAKVCIRSYPLEEYLGFVFAYLGDDQPPAFTRWPEFEGDDKGLHPSCVPRACN